MFNPTENHERRYLQQVNGSLGEALREVEEEILSYSDKLLESKRFAWENAEALDPVERAAMKISVNEDSIFGERALAERNRLRKLLSSAYFGRVDFKEAGEGEGKPCYIGIHAYFNRQEKRDVIIDWRAPISSVFYDYETGPARYLAPEGEIEGEVERKRQYRIRDGEMEYMLESSMNIGDDILAQELSRASDEKMKNIVATIQKEQNSIIRNESARVLVIQGAAGSGKTSIALHRIAFLLYRQRDTLKSEDVLILSPNKVFGSYISNVLPELGEENIPQIGMEDIARKVLGRSQRFQTFARQVADLLEHPDDEAMTERARRKATQEFLEELEAFLRRCELECFEPVGVGVEGFHITAAEIAADYRRLRHMPIRKRLEKIAADRIAAHRRTHEIPLSPSALRAIKERVLKMFRFRDSHAIYRYFYEQSDRRGLLVTDPKGELEFCDVFPLCLCRLFYEGVQHRYHEINHLLIDEMQDYTPVQYAVITKLFRCRMTILGDSHQSVNPYTSTSAERIGPFFSGASLVTLRKSYRSTIEITRFALRIRESEGIEPVERHGAEPSVLVCPDEEAELEKIRKLIGEFEASGYHSLGVVCKSQPQAEALYKALSETHAGVRLLDFRSDSFGDGIIITSCHMSKGLEFDQVIVPMCSWENYRTEMDRSLLYIACTRAMHRLDLTCAKERSGFLAEW